jgi:hypothetical protein
MGAYSAIETHWQFQKSSSNFTLHNFTCLILLGLSKEVCEKKSTPNLCTLFMAVVVWGLHVQKEILSQCFKQLLKP